MKTKKFNYEVKLCNENGNVLYTLKTFTSLQNAKKFINKEKDSVRMGISMKNSLEYRIYKIDNTTEQPITIYLN